MAASATNQLITDLSHNVAAQIAPQEAPLFRAISDAYFKNPEKTLKGQVGKDEDLGFGVAEALPLLTPIILEVIKSVVKFLSDEVTKSVKGESTELIVDQVKSMFKRFKPSDSMDKQLMALTPEQLAQVRQLSFEKARQLGLEKNQAKLLADSIVGSLSLSNK